MKYLPYLLWIGIISGLLPSLNAQTFLWKDIDPQSVSLYEESELRPKSFRALELDLNAMRSILPPTSYIAQPGNLRQVLSLPKPDGSFQEFVLVKSSVLPPKLSAKYPLIHTYKGWALDDPTVLLRLDVTYQGFHAMIMEGSDIVMIEPTSLQTTRQYMSYEHHELPLPALLEGDWCGLEEEEGARSAETEDGHPETLGSYILDYRLALAADSLYTAYHGGVSGAMSAMTTVLNQINAWLERDFAIHFTLIPNNDTLIFTGPDPYSDNGDVTSMFMQNTPYLNQTIGPANYDIGHVFTRYTGGPAAGIAYLGSICGGLKGGGGTSGSPPIGLGFTGTAAHEMGHQLGGPHTFNGSIGGCNGNGSPGNAYEPGSGTTIMSYPGLCSSHNTQSFRDFYFHNATIQDVYTSTILGKTCGDTVVTNNQEPVITAGTGGFFIPGGTPFELIGAGSDPDGNILSFCWEQYDLGPAGHPDFPTGNAPMFRSFSPVPGTSRTFPQISDIVNNTQTRGEVLVNYSRDMTFRLTARDNQGGVSWDEIEFEIWGNAGPFVVTQPNTFTIWGTNTFEAITWDVANTQNPPVNCQLVDVLLSTDGGFTYPHVLASQIPNNGFTTIQVPNTPSTTCRIRVQAADNVFFDISDENFQIAQPASPGFALFWPDTTVEACVSSQSSLTLITSAWLGFGDSISLVFSPPPQGVNVSVAPDPIMPGDSAQILISTDSTAVPGVYSLALIANAGAAAPVTQVLQLEVSDDLPQALVAQAPLNGAAGIGQANSFSWLPVANALSYTLEIATDPSFGSSVIFSQSGILSPGYTLQMPLAPGTPYYWRARGENICGSGPFSQVSGFQTGLCLDTASVDVPQTIPLFGTTREVFSDILISDSGIVSDINVINLSGTHVAIPEITASLISPTGTEVVLFSGVCNPFDQNFSLNFDDDAWQTSVNCPPIDNGTYQPSGSLSDFVGQQAAGTWTLKISDAANFNNGELQTWGLEICIAGAASPQLIRNQGLSTIQWSLDTITATLLEATDAVSGPTDLLFTVVDRPQFGGLVLNGVSLDVGETFTQDDINQGRLGYLNNGSPVPSDAFRFDVRNAAGGWIGIYTFPIEIQLGANGIGDLRSLLKVNIYPNPAWEQVFVKLEGEWNGDVELRLTNVQGQLLYQQTASKRGLQFSEQIHVSNWASGVYLLEVRTEQGALWEKVVIR